MWAVSLVAWVTYLGLEAVVHTCEFASDTSIFGDADWIWFPPGVECTYHADAVGSFAHHVDSPSVDRLGIAAVLLLWPVTLTAVRAEAKAHAESSSATGDIANPS